MTEFTAVSPFFRYVILGLMFLVAIPAFALCVYKIVRKEKCVKEVIFFAIFLTLLAFFAGSSNNNKVIYRIPFPYIVILVFAILVFVFSAYGISREYLKSKNSLSPSSVKQALDNLNSGICFADSTGRIVLINYTMGKLISSLIGSYPQTIGEIDAALQNKAEKIKGIDELYRFADGNVWKFSGVKLNKKGLEGFVQKIAQDVTDIYNANLQIEKDNEELKKVNEQMQIMLEHLADRIREQETLNLKTKIHDEIGTSLITISNMIRIGEDDDMQKQLDLLQTAVGYFSNTSDEPKRKLLDDVRKKAENMRAELVVSGNTPSENEIEEIISAAANECIINCINHAKGSKVFLKLEENDSYYFAEFTNNGNSPKSRIIEGGGLSNVRRKVKYFGGEMVLEYKPKFTLRLKLPKGKN